MKRLFLQKRNKASFVQQNTPSLALCLLMDVLGYATYAVPFFGEFFDILWAPISAFIFYKMFGGKKGIIGGLFNFTEEILPGLDFIPTFTIMWAVQYFRKGKTSFTMHPSFR